MNTMLKTILSVGAALLLVTACETPTFSGTALSSSTKSSVASAANAGHSGNVNLGVSIASGNITTTTNKEVVTLEFTKGNVDAASLTTGVSFYNLLATANADGSRDRGTPLTPTSTSVSYAGDTDKTTVYYTFDMSTVTNVSNIIEVFVDPTVVTANSGTKKLDIDLDLVTGEAQDDDFVGYVSTPGTKAVVAGATKIPQASFLPTPIPTTLVVNATTLTFPAFAYLAQDNSDYNSLFASIFKLQKFNTTTNAWVDVVTSNAYATGTGIYTVTLPAAAAGDVYRWDYRNLSSTSIKSIRGYKLKANTNQAYSTAGVRLGAPFSVTAASTYNEVYTVTETTTFDSNSYNGVVTLVFNTLTTKGLSGVTTSTIKLYDSTNGVYVPVTSAVVVKTTAANPDSVVLTLNPAYQKSGGALQVQISPSVTEGATTTNSTTDDLKLGDYTNVSKLPYGWKLTTFAAGTI